MSSFAYEFLVNMSLRLRCIEQTPYVMSMQARIEAVCRGHMRWLEWIRLGKDQAKLLESGCFAANYWVNGDLMPPGSGSWQPRNSITDTPFQILKILAYNRLLAGTETPSSQEGKMGQRPLDLLKGCWTACVEELKELDRREAFAWRHMRDDGIDIYRLDDHVWLWRCLSEVEALGLWKGHYQSDEVRRGTLQRFTTENDISRQRMLAVTRSPRETRFLFHARDTALFYGHDWKFFGSDASFNELWKRTIESQPAHDENEEEAWENVLRFALAVVSSTRGFSINKKSPTGLLKDCVAALIQVSAHNAWIPGEVDATTRTPALYSHEQDRDYYYHVGFETINILLVHAKAIDKAFEVSTPVTPDRMESASKGKVRAGVRESTEDILHRMEREHRITYEMIDLLRRQVIAQPRHQRSGDVPVANEWDPVQKRFEITGRLEKQRNSVMKKSMPYNSMIDTGSIIMIDEEWLYNYPDFLLTKKVKLQEHLKSLFDEDSDHVVAEHVGSIVGEELRLSSDTLQVLQNREKSRDAVSFVANTPKQKRQRNKRQKREENSAPQAWPLDNEQLWEVISVSRTEKTAKKRFLWLPHANTETALLCWLASTESEKPAVSLFFDRHYRYESHFWDDTTMILNTWQTELHVSFYVLVDTTQKQYVGLPTPRTASFPGTSKKEIRRASMSFVSGHSMHP